MEKQIIVHDVTWILQIGAEVDWTCLQKGGGGYSQHEGHEGRREGGKANLEDVEHTIFNSELNVLQSPVRRQRAREGKGRRRGGSNKVDLDFLFESLELSHVANQLIVDSWHLKQQILRQIEAGD
jgi:hypothetical protein